jgi:lysophospholipase L1-like esterase
MLKGLVLMTPFFIEPNCSEPMRAMMDQYGAVVWRMAEKYNAVFVDTQAAFDRVLEHVHPAVLAGDRVHPNITGHTVLARAFLRAIGFTW